MRETEITHNMKITKAHLREPSNRKDFYSHRQHYRQLRPLTNVALVKRYTKSRRRFHLFAFNSSRLFATPMNNVGGIVWVPLFPFWQAILRVYIILYCVLLAAGVANKLRGTNALRESENVHRICIMCFIILWCSKWCIFLF